jgi:glutathione S-transferase
MQEPAYDDYVFWLHYAEGSAILPILLKINASRIGEAAAAVASRIESGISTDLGFIDASLASRDYLLGRELSAADIQLSFVGELAGHWTDRSQYANMDAWVRRFQGRPAYRAAIDRGGAYNLAD